ncbi:hypothetical protein SUGI_0215740 [Cryptomeria japonica]|nr:hypothetical protein SUGI_0215740 [Cryptomeria japonica]
MQNIRLSQNQRLRLHDINRCKARSWMRAVSEIFSAIAKAKIGVDMEDALAAYRETVDVLKFVDCPENIVVDPLNIFDTLDLDGFMMSVHYEEEMREVESRLKQRLSTSHEEKRERAEQELTTQERATVNNLLGSLNGLGEQMFNSPLIRIDECSYENLKELSEILSTSKIERGVEVAGMVSELLQKRVEDGDLHSVAETETPSQSQRRAEASEEESIVTIG